MYVMLRRSDNDNVCVAAVALPLKGPCDGRQRCLDSTALTKLCLELREGHVGLALDTIDRLRERSLIPVNSQISESQIPWRDMESAISLTSSHMQRTIASAGRQAEGREAGGRRGDTDAQRVEEKDVGCGNGITPIYQKLQGAG
jgi:hypothetical protein